MTGQVRAKVKPEEKKVNTSLKDESDDGCGMVRERDCE